MKFDDDEFDSVGEDDWVVYLWVASLIATITAFLLISQ